MYHVVIADDHPLFRRALRDALTDTGHACDLTECETFDQALEQIAAHKPDLLLLDLKMPGNSGLFGLMRLRSEHPQLAIVVVSASDDSNVIANIRQLGALGFIPKSCSIEDMTQALDRVMMGYLSFPEFIHQQSNAMTDKLSSLTPQQLRVLHLIAEGALNKQIGYTLNIKETTVKSHISDIFRKLDINNRTQAALIVQQLDVPD